MLTAILHLNHAYLSTRDETVSHVGRLHWRLKYAKTSKMHQLIFFFFITLLSAF